MADTEIDRFADLFVQCLHVGQAIADVQPRFHEIAELQQADAEAVEPASCRSTMRANRSSRRGCGEPSRGAGRWPGPDVSGHRVGDWAGHRASDIMRSMTWMEFLPSVPAMRPWDFRSFPEGLCPCGWGVYNRAFGTRELPPSWFHYPVRFCTAAFSTLISQCELVKSRCSLPVSLT